MYDFFGGGEGFFLKNLDISFTFFGDLAWMGGRREET